MVLGTSFHFDAKLHRVVLDELGSCGELDWSRCAFTAKGKPFEGATVAVEERDKPMFMMTWKNQARPGLRAGRHRLLGYGKWGGARNQLDFVMTDDPV
ncbi:hypothetical protein CW362_31310 [Streptomyces populi]|uniref:Uncharacterized protein n=1 Tax=Streptomyces populi TaxID=2058924 RepID=A0A2I0SGU2_9ACTN|nr:hypothetical protein [Streptomyces populi]PKT69145.1 hypothetical protein CW362_31310 [Streptomyces populi]